MKNPKLYFVLIVLTSIFFSACINPDDIIDDELGEGTFTAKIDGVNFSVSGILITAEYDENSGVTHSMAIGAAKPPLTGTTQGFALAAVSTNSTGISVGETYSATTLEKAAACEYVFDDGTSSIKAVSGESGVGTITITALDFDTKKVSGTFSFDGVDEDDPATVYKIRDGVFKDVTFR